MTERTRGWLIVAVMASLAVATLLLSGLQNMANASDCPNGQCSRPQRPAAVQYTPQQVAGSMGQIRRASGRWMLNPNRKMPWKPQYNRKVRR